MSQSRLVLVCIAAGLAVLFGCVWIISNPEYCYGVGRHLCGVP